MLVSNILLWICADLISTEHLNYWLNYTFSLNIPSLENDLRQEFVCTGLPFIYLYSLVLMEYNRGSKLKKNIGVASTDLICRGGNTKEKTIWEMGSSDIFCTFLCISIASFIMRCGSNDEEYCEKQKSRWRWQENNDFHDWLGRVFSCK